MDMALEEDEAKVEEKKLALYMDHVSRINARQPQDRKEANAQRDFVKSLEPKKKQDTAKVYEWDEERLKRMALD